MFELVDNRISLGKETIYAFAAEIHYFRLEKKYWSLCFERAKRAGIRLITTPVPWNLHQDKNRDFDFVGFDDSRKDLTVFLELARELGFKVILRPGPYIGDDWPGGGVPEFVTSDLRSLARDSEGNEVAFEGSAGIKGGYLASYMSPSFQNAMKHYYKTFVDTTRNYIHPRGPVVMIEMDSQSNFGGALKPEAGDYNEEMLAREYAPFLMDRFEDIKALNFAYKTKYSGFDEVEPPREFEFANHKTLPRIFDWYRFKESSIQRYLESLLSLYEGYTVHPIYSNTLYFAPKNLVPYYLPNFQNEDTTPPLAGSSISYHDSYGDVARKSRYLRGAGNFTWGSSYPSGRAAEEPEQEESLQPITDGERRFLLASALGSGLKGINLKMFADHENWYGGALKADGSVTPGYEFLRHMVESAEKMELHELESEACVAVVGNRLYQWFTQLDSPKEFTNVHRMVSETLPNLCRDLSRLKIDYDVCDSATLSSEELTKYKLLLIPSGEFMSAAEQQAIVDLYKAGVSIVLFGAMPKYDENFSACATLSNFLKVKTTSVDSNKDVKTKTDTFPSYIYSIIKTTDARAKKIAHADKNVVAVSLNKKDASITFFGFDLSTGFDHHKLLFLESFLAELEIIPSVYCSDPLIDIYAHHSAKKVVVYLIAPPAGELGDRVETLQRDIFVKVNLKKLGFKSPSIKISDMFDDEETPPLKTTSAALAEGIPLRLDFPEGKVLLIERR